MKRKYRAGQGRAGRRGNGWIPVGRNKEGGGIDGSTRIGKRKKRELLGCKSSHT